MRPRVGRQSAERPLHHSSTGAHYGTAFAFGRTGTENRSNRASREVPDRSRPMFAWKVMYSL